MILILNCGSQSIKWKIFDNSLNVIKVGGASVVGNYKKCLENELAGIKEKIELVGHRVVHSGGKFHSGLEIDKNNLKELEKLNNLAPLHNPFNILGIKLCQKRFPKIKQIVVFDTDFYADLSERAVTYALPEKITAKYGIKRYGFHGISHEYAAKEAAKTLNRSIEELKVITCHLGGGSSITAIKNGKAVDTSMGFTPMEGLVMMTRCGNIDSGIILNLGAKIKNKELDYILNNESGVKGICGEGNMLEVLKMIDAGDKKAELALDVFVYSIQKYIGAYYAVLGGCDAIVFSGSIGSGSKKIVDKICSPLNILNNTKILQIQADEELAIAKKISNL